MTLADLLKPGDAKCPSCYAFERAQVALDRKGNNFTCPACGDTFRLAVSLKRTGNVTTGEETSAEN